MKNTNQNSGSKTAFKPIIATSLALALGVSVASAATQAAISTDTEIGTSGLNAAVNIGTNAYTDSTDKKTAGLFINGSASGITLTFNQNAAMDAISGSGTNSAYSILVNSGKATFASDEFKTITISAIPTNAAAGGEALVFKNAGTATFKNVGIIVGASAYADGFGIFSNLADAKYAFGTATNYIGADGVEGDIDAKAFTGVVLSKVGTLGGTLNVTGGNGYTPSTNARASFLNKDGGAGADATGISLAANLTVDTAGLNLTVTGGNGGAGANGGNNGVGGSAAGIAIDSQATISTPIQVSGGDITINLSAGNNGGSTTPNSEAPLIAINNQHATATLNFADGVNVGVGETADAAIALKSKLAGVKYVFGAGTALTFGTSFAIVGDALSDEGNGTSVTGAKILENALFGGNVEFSATGGVANTAGNGGNAVGLEVASNTLNFDAGSKLTITAVGGAKAGSGDEIGGVATGILLTTGAFDASKATSITLKAVGDDVNTSSATGIDIKTGTFNSAATLTLTAINATSSATGIKLASGSTLLGQAVTFTNIGANSATAVGIDSAGTFTLGTTSAAGVFTPNNLALGTIAGSADATAMKIANSSFTAGAITLTSLGATATNSATVLDLNAANLNMTSLVLTASSVGQAGTAITTLIKNASGNSVIASGTISVANSALQGTAIKLIDNSGTLTFGALATDDTKATNASLVIGDSAAIPSGATGLFMNGSNGHAEIDFGSATGASTVFNVTNTAGDAYGAYLKSANTLSGTATFNVVSEDYDAVGLATVEAQKILGNLTLNVSYSEGLGVTSGEGIGLSLDATGDKTLTLAKADAKNTITLNVDSDSKATGIVIGSGALTIQDTDNTALSNNLERFVFNVGSKNALEAVGIGLSGTSGNPGSIVGDLTFDSGTIGNADNTTTAIALFVGEYGTINNQSIALTSDSLLKGGEKYLIFQEDAAAKITFTNDSSTTTNKITAGTVPATETRAYGIYAGIADVGYKFGDTNGAEFIVTGAAGAKGAEGNGAAGAIIADNAFIEGKVAFTVTGGNGTGDTDAADQKGGNAVGIDVAAGKTLTASNAALTLTVDGGAGAGNGVAGDVTGIKVAQGGSFNGGNLTLALGETKGTNVTAIDLNAATFSGSFTADTTNTIGNSSAASATLIKNVGESTIASGAIKLVGAGLAAKADTGVTTIINNTGTLNFGTLAAGTASATNASLTIAGAVGDTAGLAQYGFFNNVADTAINFGIANFNTTGADVAGNTPDSAKAYGAYLTNANTTLQGTLTFNVVGGSYVIPEAPDVSPAKNLGANAYGIYASDTDNGAVETLTIANGSTVNLVVDAGVDDDGIGDAYGMYVTGNKLGFKTNGAFNLKVGTKSAANAYGFYFANGGDLDKGVITLDSSTDQIGNDDETKGAITKRSTALYIDSTSGNTNGFSLQVGKGVLKGEERYVLDLTDTTRTTAITFTTTDTASKTLVAGTADKTTGLFGIYSADAGVSYNFGSSNSGNDAGAIFSVTSSKGDAIGAIIAESANFEGSAAFKVTASAQDATAIGIRLDGTSDLNANFDYKDSTITAATGTAIALQTRGTHTISGNIVISTPSTTLAGGANYVFQNIATDGVTTFTGSLVAGTATANTSGVFGLENQVTSMNYAFGGSGSGADAVFGTVFRTSGAAYKEAGDTNLSGGNATGLNLVESATFAGNVFFDVTGGTHINTSNDNAVTVGNAVGIVGNATKTLTLADNSTLKFKVDTAQSESAKAVGIQVTTGKFTIQDNAKKPNELGTSNFIFDVGSTNASIARAIELTAGGQITGDLYVKAGSVIGNANSSESSAVVIGDGTFANNSTLLAGQSIIVEGNVVDGEDQTFGANAYVFNNKNALDISTSTDAIEFNSSLGGRIQAGTVAEGTPVYGIYHAIANAKYNFGVAGTTGGITAGTTFTIASTSGDAVGAIIAANTSFEGAVTFDVSTTAKDKTAVGIRLDNTSNFGGDFSYAGSAITANNGTAIALQTTGTHTIYGNIAIASDGTDILKGGTKYIFQNAATAENASTTFDNVNRSKTVAGSLTVGSGASGVYGLYSNLDGANYDFGQSTIFKVSAVYSEKDDTNKSNTVETVGFKLANNAGLAGNVEFNVIGGAHTNTDTDVTSGVKSATGFASSAATALTFASNSSVTFNVDTALAESTPNTNNKAVGMSVTGGKLQINSDLDKNFTLKMNVGNANAQDVRGIDLSNNGSISAIKIADGSVFGNKDYTSNLSVIYVANNAGASPIAGNVVIGDVTLNAQEGVNKYILKNESAQGLSFGETASIAVGNQDVLQALIKETEVQQKYGIYSNETGVSYDFGASSTTFTVNGSNANGSNADEKGANASGMILAADARFEGIATFTVIGGNNESGEGGDAYGIQAIGGDKILTLADTANLTFEITGGSGKTQGEAKGIYANNGTLQIVKEDTDKNGSAAGQISFTIGNLTGQTVSSGVNLDNGVFDGSINFTGVKASENAYGVFNANESIVKNGTISFGVDAFKDMNPENWAVIQNNGNLTIARDANIVAGAATANFTDKNNVALSEAGIYNNIEKATYNLGNLKLDVAKNDATKGNLYGIYSATTANAFNVAAGSTLEISAEDPTSAKAFGGDVNLNLTSEAGKQTNVYINTDGGYIANLTADDNSYIYLSGADKASRVGYASTLSFRTLEIGQISSASATTRATDTVQKGANFVVLADASRKNGTVYNTDGTLNGAAAQGSAYNADGSVSTTGGSDRIVIDYNVVGMSSVTATDNKLGVALSSLNNANQEKYVVLAQVANGYTNITDQQGGNTRLHDLVTFNGLTNNGDSVDVQTQVGFDTATITIQRHDLATAEQTGEFAGVGAVYVSNLRASDIKVDSNISDASVSAISTNFDLMSANLNSLSKRMGELRNTDNAQGVWGRVFAGQQTSNFGIEQTSTYLTFQAGYDYNISLESAVNYSGLALSYIHGSSKQATTDFLLNASGEKVAGNASASTDGVEVALYNSYISDMGLYSDSIVKFGYFTSDLNIPAQTETYNTTNFSVAVSEEIGYRVKLGAQDEWFIDPQAELAYAFISGSDFTQKIGSASLKTTQDAASLLRARVGAAWGYKFDHLGKDKGIKASLYLGTYYAYDVISGGDVNLETNNGTTTTQSLESNGRFVLNVGTDVSVQDNTKFYVDFEKSFGSTMQTDYQVSVGVRYSFGAKDASVKKDEKKEAPLKVSDTNAENN